jgi:DeoR/GlpR family transcriptional regulator of sugar metabolism
MKTSQLHINSGSEFGERVASASDQKKRIAEAVVSQILLAEDFNPANPVFISDGTTSSYVATEFVMRYAEKSRNADKIHILTNNLDVPIQVLCDKEAAQKVTIRVAPGDFSYKNCGVYGEETERFVSNVVTDCVCVLSVAGIDGHLGPYSTHPQARGIRREIMKNARQIILVADNTKLSQKHDIGSAISPNDWELWTDEKRRGRIWVATTKPTKSTGDRHTITPGTKDRRTAEQIETENRWLLRFKLGDFFINA